MRSVISGVYILLLVASCSAIGQQEIVAQTQKYILNFNTLKDETSDIQFMNKRFEDFPTVQNSVPDSSSNEIDYTRAFARVLNSYIRDKLFDFRLAVLLLEPIGDAAALKGILYGHNGDVVPISITVNDALELWVLAVEKETVEKNGANSPKLFSLSIRLQGASGSVGFLYRKLGRTSWLSMAYLEQETVKFIKKNVPDGF